MAENFVGEENLEISSNQQKGRVDSPIHCLNLAASNIILVGGTTYLSDLEHLDNWISLRCGGKGLQGSKHGGVGCGRVTWQ